MFAREFPPTEMPPELPAVLVGAALAGGETGLFPAVIVSPPLLSIMPVRDALPELGPRLMPLLNTGVTHGSDAADGGRR